MVGQDCSNGNVLLCRLDMTRHVVAHAGDTGFACLFDERAELLDTLTLLLWIGEIRHAALPRLALQNSSCGSCCKVDDAGSTHRVRR